MTALRLALRNVVFRPWRSAVLFLGYGFGVAVMIVLLAIGEAMVVQASDERLVGGGDITVLPAGIDLDVLQTGGLGGLFFSIANARFLYLQLFAAPRMAPLIRAVAPQIDGRLVYLTTASGSTYVTRAMGEIPSATSAVGAAPALAAGDWVDDAGDRRWRAPTLAELEDDIDHFHLPPPGATAAQRATWAEWQYFNVLSADRHHWAFISFIVAGDVPSGPWGGEVLVTTQGDGIPPRRYVTTVPSRAVDYSTTRADLRLGQSQVAVLPDGRYAVHARARAERGEGGGTVAIDLVVTPTPRAYFPGGSIGDGGSGAFTSGYVVPVLRGDATGRICVDRACEALRSVQAYHDHNWGIWSGVTWDWGAARAGPYTVLYGRIAPPDTAAAATPVFVYLVDSLGFRALFRPERIAYEDDRVVDVGGQHLRVPSRAQLMDVRDADTLRLDVTVADAIVSPARQSAAEAVGAGRDPSPGRDQPALTLPFFVQMQGTVELSGRVGGSPIAGSGSGFFETYR